VQIFERWLQPHIVLLDVGMATELSSHDRYNMLHLFKSFIEHDGQTMAAHALAFAGKKQRCTDPKGFCEAISECVAFAHQCQKFRPFSIKIRVSVHT
jgi:aarF domain-containing kinase